jgi:hypothetical protein
MVRFNLTRHAVVGWLVLFATPLFAAKVIMRDGKIFEGKILAEPGGDVLIKTNPVDPRAKLLPQQEILSVVRDPVPQTSKDPQRYLQAEAVLNGNVFSSWDLSMDPAASLWLGGGIRLHPVIELDAGLDWKPAMSGSLTVSDGTAQRSYERFAAYSGGFALRIYPLYYRKDKIEPYGLFGYEWSRLVPKGSGDNLNGGGVKFGAGATWPIHGSLFLDTRLIYRRTRYSRIFFRQQEGDADPPVMNDSYSFGAGVAYHFL